MGNAHIPGCRAALFTFLLIGFLGAGLPAAASESNLALGRTERWQGMALLQGVRRESGRWGELDLALADAAYEPAADTDLLLHFDASPFSDAAGRYDVVCQDPQVSERERVFGDGAAAFVTPRGSVELYARRGSLFAPGTMWQDFSVEFWLYPAALADGESILSWSGETILDGIVAEQRLSCTVRGRRLVFGFENLFLGGKAQSLELRGITTLLPRQWHHHLVRFDSRTGLLEYLVDGVVEAVTYATDTARDGGSISLPVVGRGATDPLVVGGGIEACIDELRISRRFVEEPALTRLRGQTGTAVSRIYDLKLTGTTVASIDAVYDRPADTEVYFYYRMADRLKDRGELESTWVQFVPGTGNLEGRGRYLQLMVELFPDGRLERSPSVSAMTVHYVPDLAPAPPAKVVATARNAKVSLAWSKVNETDVAGYRVYVGPRPGTYEQIVDVGDVTQYELGGLENGKLYYFTVATYDTVDTTRRSAFAPEVSARPSRLH
jgi:hypothetical protein